MNELIIQIDFLFTLSKIKLSSMLIDIITNKDNNNNKLFKDNIIFKVEWIKERNKKIITNSPL